MSQHIDPTPKETTLEALQKYTLGTNVPLSTTNYTTPSDGYFTITIASGLGRTVYGYVNDAVVMCMFGVSGQTGYPTCGIFVKKGMRIKVSEAVSGESGGLFYPLV